MKRIILLLSVIFLIAACKDNPIIKTLKVDILELTIPNNANEFASVEFKIIDGVSPFYLFEKDYQPGVLDTLDIETHHYKITGLTPTASIRRIRVMDSEWFASSIDIDFPVPEVKAVGRLKKKDGEIVDVKYEIVNFGSEAKPFYMINENIYSNIYSDGKDTPVPGTIYTLGEKVNDPLFREKEHTIYDFPQAFHVDAETFDYSKSKYDWRVQGICPNNWHIPTNDEWVYLHLLLGFALDPLPTPNRTSTNYNEMPGSLVDSPFNTVYTVDNVPNARINSGVGWWSASMSAKSQQFIYLIRFGSNKTTFNAWGPAANAGSRSEPLSVRCVFNFN